MSLAPGDPVKVTLYDGTVKRGKVVTLKTVAYNPYGYPHNTYEVSVSGLKNTIYVDEYSLTFDAPLGYSKDARCECGGDKVQATRHAYYCPKEKNRRLLDET